MHGNTGKIHLNYKLDNHHFLNPQLQNNRMAATTTEEPMAPVPSTDPQIVSIFPKTAPDLKTDEITAILDSIGEKESKHKRLRHNTT